MTRPLDPIEALCTLDVSGRGIGRLVIPGAMAAAARSLVKASRVVLVTGFVPRRTWAVETDGPSGTVVLGRALRILGSTVLYLGDPGAPLLEACLRTLREPRDVATVPLAGPVAVAAARGAVQRETLRELVSPFTARRGRAPRTGEQESV